MIRLRRASCINLRPCERPISKYERHNRANIAGRSRTSLFSAAAESSASLRRTASSSPGARANPAGRVVVREPRRRHPVPHLECRALFLRRLRRNREPHRTSAQSAVLRYADAHSFRS
jgi:hypothetical protein